MNATYPQLEAAIARMAEGYARRSPSDRERAETFDEYWRAANDAYANELLPHLLGGRWTKSRAWLDGFDMGRALFDHATIFRRQGVRGPNTWKVCAVVSHPYGAIYENGAINSDAINEAVELSDQNVGVWLRPDLSIWFPGSTQLVIAATGLHPQEAERFGFQPLTPTP
jgi:hypothetical protein